MYQVKLDINFINTITEHSFNKYSKEQNWKTAPVGGVMYIQNT